MSEKPKDEKNVEETPKEGEKTDAESGAKAEGGKTADGEKKDASIKEEAKKSEKVKGGLAGCCVRRPHKSGKPKLPISSENPWDNSFNWEEGDDIFLGVDVDYGYVPVTEPKNVKHQNLFRLSF